MYTPKWALHVRSRDPRPIRDILTVLLSHANPAGTTGEASWSDGSEGEKELVDSDDSDAVYKSDNPEDEDEEEDDDE